MNYPSTSHKRKNRYKRKYGVMCSPDNLVLYLQFYVENDETTDDDECMFSHDNSIFKPQNTNVFMCDELTRDLNCLRPLTVPDYYVKPPKVCKVTPKAATTERTHPELYCDTCDYVAKTLHGRKAHDNTPTHQFRLGNVPGVFECKACGTLHKTELILRIHQQVKCKARPECCSSDVPSPSPRKRCPKEAKFPLALHQCIPCGYASLHLRHLLTHQASRCHQAITGPKPPRVKFV